MSDGTKPTKPLSKANEIFVNAYVLTLNATAAYKEAHPKAQSTTAASNGWKLLRKTEIQKAIDERLKEYHMSADEVLKLTADIARGDVTEFFTPYGNVDWDKLRDSGKGRLVKKVKTRTITKIGKGDKDEDTEIVETELELYPADSAHDKILRVSGKYNDKVNLNHTGMTWKEWISGNTEPDSE